MGDAIDRAQASRGALERLGARLPGFSGYLDRELRREMDQRLRHELAARLDHARDAVLRRLARVEPSSPEVSRMTAAERRLDLLANTLRHSGSGFAGAFDSLKVRQEELDKLYRFDEGLLAKVDAIVAAATSPTADQWLAATEDATEALEADVARRDDVVRSVFTVAASAGEVL